MKDRIMDLHGKLYRIEEVSTKTEVEPEFIETIEAKAPYSAQTLRINPDRHVAVIAHGSVEIFDALVDLLVKLQNECGCSFEITRFLPRTRKEFHEKNQALKDDNPGSRGLASWRENVKPPCDIEFISNGIARELRKAFRNQPS